MLGHLIASFSMLDKFWPMSKMLDRLTTSTNILSCAHAQLVKESQNAIIVSLLVLGFVRFDIYVCLQLNYIFIIEKMMKGNEFYA